MSPASALLRTTSRALTRVGARVVAVAALTLVVLAVLAGPAAAHATLQASTPKQGQLFPAGRPPTTVVLRFDEAVDAKSAIGVYGGDGKQLPGVKQRDSGGTVVQAQLPALPDGPYAIVWHVVSDDGHPEHGVITFGVGVTGVSGANFGSLASARSSGHFYGFLFGVVRALGFLGALVFAGGLVVARWLWPAATARRDTRWLLVGAWCAAMIGALLALPFQAGYSTGGGWSTFVDSGALSDVLDARYGRGLVARAILLVALLPFALLRVRAPRAKRRIPVEIVVGPCALGVLATFAYAGHASTGRWIGFGVTLDLLHLAGVAFWVGGIALLAVTLGRPGDVDDTMRATARFARVALPVVGLVVLSGLLQGWRQLETWSAIWDTDYGRILFAKALVVVAIVIVASATRDILRQRIEPRLPARHAATVGGQPHDRDRLERVESVDAVDVAQLRAAILVEVGLAAVVLALTAALVVSAP
jgi:copper transport protein